jgi:hypothetical protein
MAGCGKTDTGACVPSARWALQLLPEKRVSCAYCPRRLQTVAGWSPPAWAAQKRFCIVPKPVPVCCAGSPPTHAPVRSAIHYCHTNAARRDRCALRVPCTTATYAHQSDRRERALSASRESHHRAAGWYHTPSCVPTSAASMGAASCHTALSTCRASCATARVGRCSTCSAPAASSSISWRSAAVPACERASTAVCHLVCTPPSPCTDSGPLLHASCPPMIAQRLLAGLLPSALHLAQCQLLDARVMHVWLPLLASLCVGTWWARPICGVDKLHTETPSRGVGNLGPVAHDTLWASVRAWEGDHAIAHMLFPAVIAMQCSSHTCAVSNSCTR